MKDNASLEKLFEAKESLIHGMGLFARKDIKKGTYMGTYHGPKAKRNGMHVLWVEEEEGQWIGCNGKNLLRYINHHKSPCSEFDGLKLYAAKKIRKGEEITIDYGDESGLD
ncbi:MAG: SET domain-containing protein-lysine N-methyltransferase [Gammaproteobacteria bacterium]|nr:SET domain-containing protein-lysine N-methyltransferase [Gammaproteobacteria bacterium]